MNEQMTKRMDEEGSKSINKTGSGFFGTHLHDVTIEEI